MLMLHLKQVISCVCYSVFGTNECQLQDLDLKLLINGENIERVESCKYLGIIIDSDMSWKEHIDFVYTVIVISLKHFTVVIGLYSMHFYFENNV